MRSPTDLAREPLRVGTPQVPPRRVERVAADNVNEPLAIAPEDEWIVAPFGHKDKRHSIGAGKLLD